MSYTKIGIFTLAAYPYSFKLLWSPLVDTIYFRRIGRRKSWILPLQTLSAAIMIFYGGWIESRLKAADAVGVTALFFVLVLLAATQDIAVDGWALTLLSKKNVGYAATCQTVGMNIGYFTSFTVFLALSDPEFCSSYFGTAPGVPLVTLSGYMRFWGYVYLVVTAAVALFKNENGAHLRGVTLAGRVLMPSSLKNKPKKKNLASTFDDISVEESLLGKASKGGLTPARRRSQRLASLSAAADAMPLSPFESKRISTTPGRKSNGQSPIASVTVDINGVGGGNGSLNGNESGLGWSLETVEEQPRQNGKHHPPLGIENSDNVEEEEDLREAYAQLWRVVNLPTVRLLAVLLMIARLGVLPAETAGPLKLLEKGVSKEALAGLVLVEFPIELLVAVVSGRWAASSHPLRPYFTGYKLRLFLAGATTTVVYYFPVGASSVADAPGSFVMLGVLGVASSIASTLMFTALGDFFNRISDPTMGGAYLTLLNTLANVGVVVPKLAVFAAIDLFTARRCASKAGEGQWLDSSSAGAVCGPASAAGKADSGCIGAGGTCVVVRDGFFILSYISVLLGVAIGVWMRWALRKLEAAPASEWRAPPSTKKM
jgi:Acetyl-coenzyme A transporter 1